MSKKGKGGEWNATIKVLRSSGRILVQVSVKAGLVLEENVRNLGFILRVLTYHRVGGSLAWEDNMRTMCLNKASSQKN